MRYRRLTPAQRYQIEVLLGRGVALRSIARQLKVSPSTVSRERRRGWCESQGIYVAELGLKTAQHRALGRYQTQRKVQGWVAQYIRRRIQLDWSPDQIAGRMNFEQVERPVSHTTIYRYVADDRLNRGRLWRHLRILRRQRKNRKSPAWKPAKQPYSDRVFLKDRPALVDRRKRLGDYERDTMYGKFRGAFLLTLVDRTSRFVKLAWIPKKSSDLVHEATVQSLKDEPTHTITNDNGSEFARHQLTAKALGAKVYFANSYRSWERGTNENTNGLIRQYFPRRVAIDRKASSRIPKIEARLNNRPRKCLGYRTPAEVQREMKRSLLR